mgnify:CR=1 FL=1
MNKEIELTMVNNSDRRIMELLNKEFVTTEELEEIEEHCKVLEVENCGNSGKNIGYTWFNVKTTWGEEYSVYL